MMVIVPVSLLGQTGPGQTDPVQTGPSQTGPGQTGGAILHTQGGVWVNGYEAQDSSAVFPGDLLETKPGFSANLTLDGSSVLIQPETVAKLQDGLLVLDHGAVSVGTSKSFKVRVNCITVVPILNEWTQYEVTDRNGTVQVAARKDDVNVEHQMALRKTAPETQSSGGGTVREGEQKNYNETELCGAPAQPTSPTSGLSPKWIGAGAAGGGALLCVILCRGGGGKTPVSAWQP